MMPRKNVKDLLSGISTKQKVIAVVLVIMVFFIVWQVISLFGKGGKPIPPPPMTMTKQNVAHPMQMTAPSSAGNVPGGAMISAAPSPPVQVEPRPVPTQEESELLKLQQQTQAKYIAALNELQMLKIQREIAETNQAITSAKLATVTSEKGITDLLTGPAAPPQPAVNFGSYASQLASPAPTAEGGEAAAAVPPPPPLVIQRPVEETPYVVISVSMQLGTWRAVIGYQGKLFSVTVGDTLPIDGAKVVSISRRGVQLKKDGKTRRIPITSVI